MATHVHAIANNADQTSLSNQSQYVGAVLQLEGIDRYWLTPTSDSAGAHWPQRS